MKISILSMQRVNNFGSLLQAYSLRKILKEKAEVVSFIDIKTIAEDYALAEGNLKNCDSEYTKKSRSKLLNKLLQVDKYIVNRIINKKKQEKQFAVFDDFRINALQIKDSDNFEHYDLCVIGSDTVFNCILKTKWGFTSQLFGNVEQADSVITYAASCGLTKYENVPEAVLGKIKEVFSGVLGFSLRDKNTVNFVEKLTNKKLYEHLDPVLVGDFSEEIAQIKDIAALPKKYCIVYAYHNRIHKKEEIKAIKKFCKEKKLEIVAIGAPQKWIKNYLVLNPFEMLVAFEKADFVITDTFHGTIFASKYNGKFATILRGSNENKLGDLVNRIGISDHVVSTFDELQKAWDAPNSLKSVNELCKKEREKTIEYFDECIKNLSKEGK